MIALNLSYLTDPPTQGHVTLPFVPRAGDHVRLANGDLLVVEHVLWIEGESEEAASAAAEIMLMVRPYVSSATLGIEAT